MKLRRSKLELFLLPSGEGQDEGINKNPLPKGEGVNGTAVISDVKFCYSKTGLKLTTLYIVDDEESVRTALSRLFLSANMQVQSFASVEEILKANKPDEKSCVIADISLPGTSGLELPALLLKSGCHYPVIFLSAQDTEQLRIDAKRVGAAGFFRKPVDATALLDAIKWVSATMIN